MKTLRYTVLVLTLCLFASVEAFAVNRNWVGGASTNTWSQAANWSPAGVPANGDYLTFGTSSGVPTINDLVGLRLERLSVGHGDTLSGQSIVLSNGILCTAIGANINRINLDIELAASQSFECGEGNLMFGGVVDVNGYLLTLDPFDNEFLPGSTLIEVDESGLITGAGSVLILAPNTGGSGYVKVSGTIGVSGGVTVYGEVHLSSNFGPALTTDLEVMPGGILRFDDADQISSSSSLSIRVRSGGELISLSTIDNRVPNLRLDGGSLVTIFDNGGINPGLITTTNLTVFATNTTAQIVGGGDFGFGTSTPVTIYGGPAVATPELSISAQISTGGFEKFGPGRMRLSGTNTFSGSVIVSEGIVEAASATALGNTTGSTFLTGGELRLANALVGGESLYAQGNAGSTSRLYAPNGTVNSWAGSVFLNSPLEVALQGSASVNLTGVIQDTGALIKSGDGTLRMSGSSPNTYTGLTLVREGMLELQKSTGDAIVGPLLISTGTNSLETAVVKSLTGTVIGGPVTVNRYGTLNLNGYSDGLPSLTLNGGTVETGVGTISFTGNPTIGPLPLTSTLNGNWDISNVSRVLDIPTGASLNIGANVPGSASAGLIKNGGGNLGLSGNNSYPGLTTINSGRVAIGNVNALGSTAVGTVLNGGTLDLAKLTYPAERLTNNSAASVISFGPYATPGGAVWVGGITLNAELEVNVDEITGVDPLIAPLTISSTIDGSFGLRKTGDGRLILSGGFDNTFTGTAYVDEGTVELGKTSGLITIPRDLVIGTGPFGNPATVRYLAGVSNTVGAAFPAETGNITVNGGGLLDLNGQTEGFDSPLFGSSTPLVLYDGGDVQTGAGRLNFPSSTGVYVDPGLNGSSTISGRLGLASGAHTFNAQPRTVFSGTAELTVSATLEAVTGTATVTKSGNGRMRLTGNNTFTGVVTVNGGQLLLANANALGVAGGGVNVNNGGSLAIDGSLLIDGEPLVLNTTNTTALAVLVGNSTWDNPVTLNRDANIDVAAGTSLRILNAIAGNFALTKSGPGTLAFGGATANSYTNATIVNAGTLVLSNTAVNLTVLGPLVIGDDSGGVNADVVRLNRTRQIANPVAVTINSSGLLDLNGYSDAFGSLAGNGNVAMPGPADLETGSDNTSTTFGGSMSGSANFWKHGTGTQTLNGTNTYTGLTIVEGAGKLIVNGAQPQSPVIISNSATLGGTGIVGHITAASSATVSPGSSAGILTCSNVTFAVSSTFRVELNGPDAGTGYDQLNVRGQVALLGQAILNPSLSFASSLSNTFTIINNDGADAVISTFAGLPQNATVNISGIPFRISYTGGTGNDVVLTQLLPPPALASLASSATNLVLSWPSNYLGFVLESSTNLTGGVWATVIPPAVLIGTNHVATNSLTDPQRFFRLRQP